MLRFVRHQLWMSLGRRRYARSLFALYEKHCSDGVAVVGEDTDIVIEGYPRSANTFAVAAFRLAQPATPRIATTGAAC